MKNAIFKYKHYYETKYGFEFGSDKITRQFTDKKSGRIMLEISTAKQGVQVYIAKNNKTRVCGYSE